MHPKPKNYYEFVPVGATRDDHFEFVEYWRGTN